MARDDIGIGTTTLGVRLPVRLVGQLYVTAGERGRNVSAIVGDAIEAWLEQGDTPDGSPSKRKPKAASKQKVGA
jgi:hypothetical protein